MEDNAISEEKALETGFELEPYTGPDIIVGNGDTFRPVGYIELQFHFQKVQAAKSWKLKFLVIPHDPPCTLRNPRSSLMTLTPIPTIPPPSIQIRVLTKQQSM